MILYPTRDALRQMIVDSIIFTRKTDISLNLLEDWLIDQKDLLNGLTDMAMNQFAAQDSKIDYSEFVVLYKVSLFKTFIEICIL